MAIKKEIELKVDATQAEKALDKFGGTLEDVYGEGVQPLNFAIGELEDRLYEMAAAGDTSSQAFKDMSEEVGRMKKTIIDVDMVVDGLSQTTAQNLGGAVGGLASGFELAQGAMGAFGAESQAVEETLLKVQSAMAISQGLQGIKESIASFKGLGAALGRTAAGQVALNIAQKAGAVGMRVLNAVMNANPVFLLISAFAALAGAVAYFASNTKSAAELNEELNESMERSDQIRERSMKSLDRIANARIKLLQLEGAEQSKILKEQQAQDKVREKARLDEAKMIKQFTDRKIELLREATGDEAEQIKEEIKANQEKLRELNEAHLDYKQNRELIAKEITKAEEEEARKQAEDEKANQEKRVAQWKQYQSDRLSAKRQIEDLELEINNDEIEANRVKYERLIEDTKSNESLKEEEKLKIIERYQRLQQDSEQAIIDQQIADGEAEIEAARALEKAKQDAILEEQKAAIQAQAEAEQQAMELRLQKAAEEEERRKQLNQQRIDLTKNALTAVADLANAFAGQSEEAQRRAFNINKGVGIANAIINTAQGVTQALATLPPPISFLTAATTAAAGAAQIATIAKTKFDSGGGASGGGSSISSPTVASASSPAQFNIVGNTGNNQLAETLGQLNNQPVKAYVTSGDMTTAQSLDRNKIESATL